MMVISSKFVLNAKLKKSDDLHTTEIWSLGELPTKH